MNLSKLCSCLNNTAQIDGTINDVEQINSKMTTSGQINSDFNNISRGYKAKDSDNIEVFVDNTTNDISATIKEIQFDSAENFPEIGSDRLIYVDKSTKNAYIWDSETQTYNSISNGGEIAVDSELSNTSENPVQNKVITDIINKIVTNKTQISGDSEGKFIAGKVLSSKEGSVGIGGNVDVGDFGVVLGWHSSSKGNSDVVIGVNSKRTGDGYSSVAIGGGCKIAGVRNVALGSGAEITNSDSTNTVQIAAGTNDVAGSLQFRSFQLVDPNGKIPNERLSVDVSMKSDLENYLKKQSNKEGVYSQVTNQDGQFSVNISENGDTQTFIINKNGATLNGSNLFTSVGGTITGDVNIQGNVTVTGDTTIEKTKNLEVENAIIYTNANKTELKTILSGLAIYKDGTNIYGIMYDPATDSVKLGLGTVDAEGKFIFNSGEGKPVAVRSDSSLLVDGHLIKWDSASNSFVDSGKEISENATAHSIAERTIGGALKSTPISDIDIENQTNNTVATKKDISNKVDKVEGKQLSSNDYTDDDKTKLSGLSNYDDTNIKKEISEITDAIRDMDAAFSQELANKQNTLTAGNNITISDNTISAIDTKYTAGTGIEINADNVISAVGESGPNVVQATGQSETDVMSQKATTDALGNKITKNMLDIYVGTNDTCSDAEGNFGQCSQIYKSDGTSYAVRQFLFNKDDFQQDGTNEKTKYSLATDVLRTASISQKTGSATDKIMSQDSVTKELAKSVKKTDIVDNLTTTDATKVLSANQGKVLDDKVSAISGKLARKVETGGSSGSYTTYINNNGNSIELIIGQGNTRVAEILLSADGINVNTTQTFKLNGGTIAYDSATDTFTI